MVAVQCKSQAQYVLIKVQFFWQIVGSRHMSLASAGHNIIVLQLVSTLLSRHHRGTIVYKHFASRAVVRTVTPSSHWKFTISRDVNIGSPYYLSSPHWLRDHRSLITWSLRDHRSRMVLFILSVVIRVDAQFRIHSDLRDVRLIQRVRTHLVKVRAVD